MDGDEILKEAQVGSVVVWAVITIALWLTFIVVFFLALFNYVPWASPIAPLVLAALSSASNPAQRIIRAQGGNVPRK